MRQVDYIIVGCGLASISFCEELRVHKKSFVVFDDNSQKSSVVAAGMYNPVILKRFSEAWKAKEQLEIALPFYRNIEEYLSIKIDYKLQLLRRFTSVEEQNLWFSASDKPKLEPYLATNLVKNTNSFIDAPFGFGQVLHTGRIDTELLINSYKLFLSKNDSLEEQEFVYDKLKIEATAIHYEKIKAKHIIFADGFGIKRNPYFNHLPLIGTKGEVLIVKAPDLKIEFGIKSSVFIIPISNDLYYVGATYNRKDKTHQPSDEGKNELVTKLKTFIKCDFQIVNHVAGIRPTVKDRRPLIGRHHKHHNLYALNGLGTRGVMIAPYVAKKLFNLIEHNKPLDNEIDINRF